MRLPIFNKFARLAPVLIGLLLFEPPLWACTPPTLDSSGHSTRTNSVTLSTSHVNDILIYHILTFNNNASSAVSGITSITDTAGLTFTQRGVRQTFLNPGLPAQLQAVDVFWAYSPGTLTGDVINVTYATPGTVDRNVTLVAAFSGVSSFVTPFDSNVAIPAYAASNGPSTPTTVVSTTGSADLILTSCDGYGNGVGQCSSTGSGGYTEIVFDGGIGPLCCASTAALYYNRVFAPQVSVSAPAGSSATTDWESVGDALTGDQSGCPSNKVLQFQTPVSSDIRKPRLWQ